MLSVRPRDRAHHAAASIALALAILSGGGRAFADASAADRALAQTLFEEGRTLMQAGQLAEACVKLEKSEALDPSGGTLLNLARCHEQQGRTATAWTEYHDAIAMARRDKRDEREEFAQKQIAALDPVLSRLTVKVAAEGSPEGLEILRNGAPLRKEGWNVAAPVDPGPQAIVARAPGYEDWSATVVVGERGDAKVVEVPPLRKGAGAASGAPVPQGGGVQRPIGIALGAVGVVAAGVGVGFGVHALSRDSTAHQLCKSDTTCAPGPGLDASNDAVTSAKVADGLIIGGAVLAGVGLAVALTAKTGPSAPSAALVVAPRRLGLAVSF